MSKRAIFRHGPHTRRDEFTLDRHSAPSRKQRGVNLPTPGGRETNMLCNAVVVIAAVRFARHDPAPFLETSMGLYYRDLAASALRWCLVRTLFDIRNGEF
jgi:hypothetical protein